MANSMDIGTQHDLAEAMNTFGIRNKNLEAGRF